MSSSRTSRTPTFSCRRGHRLTEQHLICGARAICHARTASQTAPELRGCTCIARGSDQPITGPPATVYTHVTHAPRTAVAFWQRPPHDRPCVSPAADLCLEIVRDALYIRGRSQRRIRSSVVPLIARISLTSPCDGQISAGACGGPRNIALLELRDDGCHVAVQQLLQ